MLDRRTLSGFQNGDYLAWNVSGSVTILVTNLDPISNAVISGLFFGTRPVPYRLDGHASSGPSRRRRATGSGPTAPRGSTSAQDPSANNPTSPAYAIGRLSNGDPLHLGLAHDRPPRLAADAARIDQPDRLGLVLACSHCRFDVQLTDGRATHTVALYALD